MISNANKASHSQQSLGTLWPAIHKSEIAFQQPYFHFQKETNLSMGLFETRLSIGTCFEGCRLAASTRLCFIQLPLPLPTYLLSSLEIVIPEKSATVSFRVFINEFREKWLQQHLNPHKLVFVNIIRSNTISMNQNIKTVKN